MNLGLTNPDYSLGYNRGIRWGRRLWDPDGCQLHDSAFLNLPPLLSKVPLGIKRPVEAAGNTVRQTLDVNLNLCIDFWTPGWKASPDLDETIDRFLTEVSNEIHGLLEAHLVVTYHGHDYVVLVAFGLFTIVREEVLENVESENWRKVSGSGINTYVRPGDKIVRRFIQTLDGLMFHNLVGQIQAVCIFDQSPGRLTSRSIPAHGNVILKTGNDAGGSVTSLDSDGFEEEVHGVDESFLRSWGTFSYEACPVTKRRIEWSAALMCGREIQTFSPICQRESWDRMRGVGGKRP